ncbi:hypothetical protein PMZ80_004579 [Knufia obscura]|uniref:glucan endo-1,3-beta-D-glucosidase n=2 Tax=Knufia TaxID=430999 RepID=A0AAN8EEY7_9EURO|nr:hypothetical protein PMZ80_004579 [Knufia obscura]KAK5952570.1 hypothetical protein OHC33_006162 [Knufia fluminis]
MRFAPILALVATTLAAEKGFNYGATFSDGTIKHQADFEGEFNSAKNMVGNSFPSARLYTMIQGDTNGVIEAIPAAISTKTTLLLGLWASGGVDGFNAEVQHLADAVNQYGTAFTDLVVGISVGSEDVYRTTDLGIASNAGPGVAPNDLVNYVNQVKSAISGTGLSGKPVGHVDTYNTWTNTSYTAGLTAAVDFIGVDAYPYYESSKVTNGIENAQSIFWDDWNAVVAIAQGKPLWLTETGWPVEGPTVGQAVASVDNAARYYSEVGCQLFAANINTWWFTLQDQQPVAPAGGVIFAVTGPGLPPPTTPLYDLSCQ